MDLTMTRGDSYTVLVTATNSDGSVRNITGATLTMTAKHGYDDLDNAAVFQVSQGPTNPTQGSSTMSIPSSATQSLPRLSVLVYDVELLETTGQRTTIQSGKLVVSADVSIA